jgi:hemoglobin
MKDIQDRQDIENLLQAFYGKAIHDPLIGYLFTDVAKLDLEEHLPIITDFWEAVLFQTLNFQARYERSPMTRHIELNEKEPLLLEHFRRWLEIFDETVDHHFAGEKAELAKFRARAIAQTMFLKVSAGNSAGVQVSRE